MEIVKRVAVAVIASGCHRIVFCMRAVMWDCISAVIEKLMLVMQLEVANLRSCGREVTNCVRHLLPCMLTQPGWLRCAATKPMPSIHQLNELINETFLRHKKQ